MHQQPTRWDSVFKTHKQQQHRKSHHSLLSSSLQLATRHTAACYQKPSNEDEFCGTARMRTDSFPAFTLRAVRQHQHQRANCNYFVEVHICGIVSESLNILTSWFRVSLWCVPTVLLSWVYARVVGPVPVSVYSSHSNVRVVFIYLNGMRRVQRSTFILHTMEFTRLV